MLDTLQYRIDRYQRLSELRMKLLRLHKILLDAERVAYEQVRGKITSGEMLRLAIDGEQFAWLRQISQIIVQIDHLLQSDEPLTPEAIATLIADVRTLLVPDEDGNEFAMKYDAALQRYPDVVLAHADVVRVLASDFQG
ncbi:MAG: hypothetical protein KME17_25920 [Cyanosarcina radialis HA8281-LM2]|jgi:hypothetical protein|nr:hypothetical protein [Cyanosarcina radialis HA8281-LM2]